MVYTHFEPGSYLVFCLWEYQIHFNEGLKGNVHFSIATNSRDLYRCTVNACIIHKHTNAHRKHLTNILAFPSRRRVPVYSRNWHDIVFRSVEVGVALWFPCCLWNSMKPEQLWILNPRRLLRRQVDPVAGGDSETSSIERVCLIALLDSTRELCGSCC